MFILICLAADPVQARYWMAADAVLPYGIGLALGHNFDLNKDFYAGYEFSTHMISDRRKDVNTGNSVLITFMGSRLGLVAKLKNKFLPFKIHGGFHWGTVIGEGSGKVEYNQSDQVINLGQAMNGVYLDLGLEYNFDDVFIETSIGTQTFNLPSQTFTPGFPSDVGLRIGGYF